MGAVSTLPLNTCSQVLKCGRAPQLETGTGKPPPPGSWPVPPSQKTIAWALRTGGEQTQEVLTWPSPPQVLSIATGSNSQSLLLSAIATV